MEEKLYIKTLGGFSITYGQNTISDSDNRSKKIWILLEYLVTFHSKEIPQSTLVELFWVNDSISSDPENALKTSLHRARSILGFLNYPREKLILHKRNTFKWNTMIPYEIDAELFEQAYHFASSPERSGEEKLLYYQKAFDLYNGDYLPKAKNEDWAYPITMHYHSIYVHLIHEYFPLLESMECYQVLHQCSQKAITIEPYDELLYYYNIISLYRLGKTKEAIEQYHKVLRLFYDNFGINPSQNLTGLYREITKQELTAEADLNVIQEDLKEDSAIRQAYCCDYFVFRHLYQIEARAAERSGLCIYLCLLTLESFGKSNEALAQGMDRIASVIATSLRSGDVYSRYSKNQYIVMLPSANFENCLKIANRIISTFTNSKPKLNCKISYNLKHLEPQKFSQT